MSLGPISSSGYINQLLSMRKQLDVLQQQLGTGKKSTTYRDLGADRAVSLNARGRLDSIAAYQSNISTVNLRLNIVQTVLQRFSDLSSAQSTDNNAVQLLPSDGTQPSPQRNAKLRLDEVLSLMNQDVNGRRMFSGRATDKPAALSTDVILNGLGSQAGLKDVIEERRRADTGSDNLGRLTLTTPAANSVTLSQVNGVDFGYKIGTVSNDLTNVTATPTSGPPPSVNFAFTGLPVDGEKIGITLTLPDGTSAVITLRASNGSNSNGDFAIGADANATAANFNAALNGQIQEISNAQLRTASALKASDDFFNVSATRAPQRVNIVTTPEAATSLRDGTPTDTITWYQGDDTADDPRSTSTVRADNSLTLGYGMRATEANFRTMISNLAAFAAVNFSSTEVEQYNDMASKVRTNLGQEAVLGISTVQTELASVQVSLKAASERHVSTTAMFQNVVDGVENISKEEVAVQILELKTRLEASYQVTANLSQLSLVNFLR